MPCPVPARGVLDSTWNDKVNNTPCGKPVVQTANGVNYATHGLCLLHLKMKLGQLGIEPPYTFAP